jgi:hypothetical protein
MDDFSDYNRCYVVVFFGHPRIPMIMLGTYSSLEKAIIGVKNAPRLQKENRFLRTYIYEMPLDMDLTTVMQGGVFSPLAPREVWNGLDDYLEARKYQLSLGSAHMQSQQQQYQQHQYQEQFRAQQSQQQAATAEQGQKQQNRVHF